ncbi:Mrl1p [Sporobolomyces koalae]|uniref:Mrl1p n=1 Tax=Sporobolomyces koalae TaxID=500713 RepID=UPI00317BEABD
MRSLSLAVVAGCVSLSLVNVVAADSCVIQGKSIGKFDLNRLRKASDYAGITNPDGGDISLNFCGAVKDDAIAAGEGAGAYIEDSRGGISLGKYSTVPQYHNGQLSVSYREGAACPKSNARRSSLIYLQCDKSWSSSDIKLIDSIDDCFYVFTMKTPHACSQSLSGGFFGTLWSLTVSLFWLLVIAAVGLFAYTRFIQSKHASSGFNNDSHSKLGEAVGFVKDMVIIVGVWGLDTIQSLISKFQRRSSSSSSHYNPYTRVETPRSSAGTPNAPHHSTDYSSSAWKATTRVGPPEPPAKDTAPPSSSHQPQSQQQPYGEETMPGLAGGGSLLDDDDEDDEGDELTMSGTGGIKV